MTENAAYNSSWGSGSKRRSMHRPKKLEPLQDGQLMSKPNQMSKTKPIHSKRDLIEAVRKISPNTSQSTSSFFGDVAFNLKTSNIDESDVRQQLNIVENDVNDSARRYNDLHVLCDRKTQELKTKLDELESIKTEYEGLSNMKKGKTHESDRIAQLEKQVSECALEIAQKTHYQRQLEHMLQRLHRNQLKFDAHLNGMEEARKAVLKEYEDVSLLRRTMDAGLVRAHYEAQEAKDRLEICNKERSILLAKRMSEKKNAIHLQEWMRNRTIEKAKLATELRGDLTKEEEGLLRMQLREKEENTKKLQRANEESQKRITAMEDAFMLIKQVTGVSSLEEIVEKFSNQRINKKNLEKDVRDTEHKLAEAKKAAAEADERFQDVKSSGSGADDLNRERIDQMEEEIASARNELKITKAATERLGTVLVALRQGAYGLLQRIQPYKDLIDSPVFELTATRGEEDDSCAETMDALSNAEQCLSKMLELIGGAGDVSPAKFALTDDENIFQGFDDLNGSRSLASRSSGRDSPPSKNNVRVKSRRHAHGSDVADEDDFSSAYQGFGGGGGDQSPSGSGASMTGDETEVVPTRSILKKYSVRTSQDEVKKAEMASRRRHLAERLTTGELDEKDLGNAARMKAQISSSNRLSSFQASMHLPEGVTLRDGPMVKTEAFLKHKPNLA
mmetsp:Transcript_5027/g.5156  ORF Transcript_5027/g.5156 Transcript_5027/m.5156 type:complete len:675 (-) Transcript_5027:185-2209(-)|eukprot:CAMPEP_0182420542 /NCGR_PEP_ID=MMETSP1167-20130531/5411_1 /TAXON_ID=2988 /ORGANISM="Mallomonas Sp, Strain CCMP3275" /LENGTH=674 /DNA_ID=CAMNT_0024596617 /DNA_START=167 /DNA_END=2191 /DNA_ORIENTATION=+